MKFRLISCEVLYREMCASIARSPHQVDAEFLPKGLHDIGGAGMCRRLQEAVDRADASPCDAVLLGYALCGNGIAGLTARRSPLVVPRAHDCIALLMGSRERYQQYFEANSGVYYRSTGWLERGGTGSLQPAVGQSLEDLIARYGEDNGRYLFEQLTSYQHNYSQLTYIETGLEPDGHFEEQARREAERKGWRFEKVRGDLTLFEALVNGDWNERDFLVVPPGRRLAASYDDGIVRLAEDRS